MRALVFIAALLAASPAAAWPVHGVSVSSGGVSGGAANCPYDTYATDGCGAAAHYGVVPAALAIGSTNFFTSYAPQNGQNYTTTFTGSITNSVLTVTAVTGTPFVNAEGIVPQTITDGGGVLPAGVYIKTFGTGTGGTGTYNLSGSGATLPSQTFTAIRRPPWNASGVDYSPGAYTSVAAHTDPALIGSTIPGCSYSPTTGLRGPIISCAGLSGTVTIAHLDLSGVRFGHNCTSIRISSAAAGTNIIFDDLYWENEPTCFNAYSGGSSQIISTAFVPTSGANFTLQYSTWIGHGLDASGWCPGAGQASCPAFGGGKTMGVANFQSTGGGTAVMQYNSFLQFPGHTFGLTGLADNPPVQKGYIRYNYTDTNHTRVPQGHGAWGSFGNNLIGQYLYNTDIYTAPAASTIALSSMLSMETNIGLLEGDYLVDHNLLVMNAYKGVTNKTSLTADINVVGPNATISNLTGGGGIVGVGAGVSKSGDSVGMYLFKNVSGGQGNGGVWTYDCNVDAKSGRGLTICGAVTQTIGGTDVDQTVNPPGSGTSPGVFTAMSIFASPSAAFLSGPHGSFNSITATNNYGDGSGNSMNAPVFFDASGVTCVIPTVLNHNVDMLTGGVYNSLNLGTGC